MGAIVPEPIEQYLAGLNRLADSVLKDIAQAGRQMSETRISVKRIA